MSDGIWMTLGGALLLVLAGEAALHGEAAAGLLAAVLGLALVATAVKELRGECRHGHGFDVMEANEPPTSSAPTPTLPEN